MRIPRVLCVVLLALPVMAAENDSKAMFAKHWQVAKEFTLAVAEAMPAEGYDFKPNPEELSFGQLMIHIAKQNSDSCARPEPRGSPNPLRPTGRRPSSFSPLLLTSAPKRLMPCRRSSGTRRFTNFEASRCSRAKRCGIRSRIWHIIAGRPKSICE